MEEVVSLSQVPNGPAVYALYGMGGVDAVPISLTSA
jgi:hypothetical protein